MLILKISNDPIWVLALLGSLEHIHILLFLAQSYARRKAFIHTNQLSFNWSCEQTIMALFL
jgi:hypothetical protein